ncbi:type VI secretion system baseplate subunit TssE [bacterium]|nr:type VI secretion system baseplate subunit TssE [bacterium]
MPELIPRDRLLPCLLARLTDEEPRQVREGRDRRVVSPRQYVQSVREDIRSLLNARAHTIDDPIQEFPDIIRSVINYGMPDLCGLTAGGMDTADIESRLRQAILAFEPRLVAQSLDVRVSADPDVMGRKAVSFEISGQLWMQPAPQHFYVKTEVDPETGQWDVSNG